MPSSVCAIRLFINPDRSLSVNSKRGSLLNSIVASVNHKHGTTQIPNQKKGPEWLNFDQPSRQGGPFDRRQSIGRAFVLSCRKSAGSPAGNQDRSSYGSRLKSGGQIKVTPAPLSGPFIVYRLIKSGMSRYADRVSIMIFPSVLLADADDPAYRELPIFLL